MPKYLTEATPSETRRVGGLSDGLDSLRAQIREEVQSLFENQLKSLLRQEVKDQVSSSILASRKAFEQEANFTMEMEGDGPESGFGLSQSQMSSLILDGLRSGV
jgi:FKBP-type peptidyl-prolyl cis-trans isomerase (trigger factor)